MGLDGVPPVSDPVKLSHVKVMEFREAAKKVNRPGLVGLTPAYTATYLDQSEFPMRLEYLTLTM